MIFLYHAHYQINRNRRHISIIIKRPWLNATIHRKDVIRTGCRNQRAKIQGDIALQQYL